MVRPDSEVGRIVSHFGGEWVTDSADPDGFPRALAEILDEPEEIERRGVAAHDFAARHFTGDGVAEAFERVLLEVVVR